MQKRKGFTLVELVIVIAVIAILAGVLIGTFASVLSKAQESARMQEIKAAEHEQKANDLLKKIEDSNWYGWEDFEASIVAKLTKEFKNSTNTEGKLTAEEIKDAVKSAMDEFAKNNADKNTGLTEDQVKAIVENAIGTIKFSGVTEGQVKAIVSAATNQITATQLSAAQVKSIIAAANEKNLTAAQVSSILATALKDVVTKTDLDTAISTAIAQFEQKLITDEDVAKVLEDLVPVTKSTTSATEFASLAKSLNSGSTLVWAGEANVSLSLTLDADDVKTLSVKGTIGTLIVNAPKGTIYVLGKVTTLDVKAIANDSLHVYGEVENASVQSGRLVLEAGAKVTGTLTAKPSESATVTLEIEKNANVNKLVAEYQHYEETTKDYIEISNNGKVSEAYIAPVDAAWTNSNNTTNVRVVNGEGAEGTSVASSTSEPTEGAIIVDGAAGAQIIVVEGSDSSTYLAQDTTLVETENTTDIAFWGELYATSFAAGKGTVASPYQISNATELTRLSWLMLNSPDEYKGAYYELISDIDLTGKTWMPISAYSRNLYTQTGKDWFCGSFDGNGYSVTGLTDSNIAQLVHTGLFGKNSSTVTVAEGEYTFGLFGSVKTATIENVNLTVSIDNEKVIIENKTYVADSVGALVGFSGGNLTVNNISVSGSIKGTDSVAGVVGRLYDKVSGNTVITITNCVNNATIIGYNTASANGYARCGGIFAYIGENNENVTISGNTNNGDITINQTSAGIYCGGIGTLQCNNLSSATVSENTNNGDIIITTTAESYTAYVSFVVNFEKNVSSKVTATGNSSDATITINGDNFDGFVVGSSNNNVDFQN